jgi:hypothetical protein
VVGEMAARFINSTQRLNTWRGEQRQTGDASQAILPS